MNVEKRILRFNDREILDIRDAGRRDAYKDVMILIEAEMPLWSEDTPPRHALSVLWGKIRDMKEQAS